LLVKTSQNVIIPKGFLQRLPGSNQISAVSLLLIVSCQLHGTAWNATIIFHPKSVLKALK